MPASDPASDPASALAELLGASATERDALVARATEIAAHDDWWAAIVLHRGRLQAVPCDAMWGTRVAVVFKDGAVEAYDPAPEARKGYKAQAMAMRTDDDIPDLDPARLAALVPRAARIAVEDGMGFALIVHLRQPRSGGVTHDVASGSHNLGADHYVVFADGTFEKLRKTQWPAYRERADAIRDRLVAEGAWGLTAYATATLATVWRPRGHGDPLPPGTELDVVNESDWGFKVTLRGETPNCVNCFWLDREAVRDLTPVDAGGSPTPHTP